MSGVKGKGSGRKKGSVPWAKGKNKEDYPQMSNSGRKVGSVAWNKGLKGDTDPRVRAIGANKTKLFHSARRRARKMLALGSHTFGEWELLKKQYGFRCLACGRAEPEIVITEDHIIPLSKGGTDFIENIQPLCRSCNSRKNARVINYKI
jgi:hypothetical protein